MGKILEQKQLEEITQKIHQTKKSIVLVGGVFDILHPGHIHFLENAKKEGDILIVLLESDEAVKKNKGKTRPLFSQKERAFVLSAVIFVDYIVKLSGILSDRDYFELTNKIKPDIIAATEEDNQASKKREQANLFNAQYKEVVGLILPYSSSEIIKKIL